MCAGSSDHLPDGRIRVNKLEFDLGMRLGKHSEDLIRERLSN
jgi:hypothetical protein